MPIRPIREPLDMSQTPVARRLNEENREQVERAEPVPRRPRPAPLPPAARVEIGTETAPAGTREERERAEQLPEPADNTQPVPTPQPLNPSRGMINLTA